jgi:hypothetical protein
LLGGFSCSDSSATRSEPVQRLAPQIQADFAQTLERIRGKYDLPGLAALRR